MAALGDIYSVKLFSRITPIAVGSQLAINVLHYRVEEVLGLPKDDQEIADAFSDHFGPVYGAYLSVDASFRGVIVQKINPLPVSIAVSSTSGQQAGVRVAGDLLPPQVSGMITKQTGGAGRAKRGRIYMPFPGEDDVTDSIPNAAYIAALSATLTSFVTFVLAGPLPNRTSFGPVIFHRANPGNPDPIATAVARPYFTTQRRRAWVTGADISPIG